MEIQIQPVVTMNVGDNQSTASTAISYTAYEEVPLNPTIGDCRMVPNLLIVQNGGLIEMYDPDRKEWRSAPATIYDLALAGQVAKSMDIPAAYVYYRLNINSTGPGKVVEGDTRKPSFAIDHDAGE